MPFNFQKINQSVFFQTVAAAPVTLVANAASAAIIAQFDTSALTRVTLSAAVTVAPLTALEIWVRGDPQGAPVPLSLAQTLAYGRSDAGSDVATTPANVSATIVIDCANWSEVQLRAKSAGAAIVTVTAGGQ